MKQRILWATSLMMVWASVCPGGQEILVDGVLHVRNAAEPDHGRETLELEELWRVGGDNDELFFGLVGQVRVDETGNVLLLDEILSQVFVLNQEGELINTLSRLGDGPGETRDPNDMVLLPDGRVGVGPDGRVYCATEFDPYRIMIFNVDGTVDRVVEREYIPVERTSEEYDDIFSLFDSMLQRAVPPPYELTVDRCEPAICWKQKGLQIATDGRLWILPSSGVRNQPKGIFQTFDVFSQDGHFEKQVSIPGEGDPRDDAVFLAGANHLVRVIGFADALRAKAGGGAGGDDEEEVEPIQVVYYAIR